jgi:hypothetical protein
MEFGPMKFQQGAIRVAEADFTGKSGDFGVVGGNVGGGWPLPCVHPAMKINDDYGVFDIKRHVRRYRMDDRRSDIEASMSVIVGGRYK